MTVPDPPPLSGALGIPGAHAVSLLDPDGPRVLWWAGAAPPGEQETTAAVTLAAAAAGLVLLGEIGDELGDILLTSREAFHVVRLVDDEQPLVAHLTLRRAGANLAMARREFGSLVQAYAEQVAHDAGRRPRHELPAGAAAVTLGDAATSGNGVAPDGGITPDGGGTADGGVTADESGAPATSDGAVADGFTSFYDLVASGGAAASAGGVGYDDAPAFFDEAVDPGASSPFGEPADRNGHDGTIGFGDLTGHNGTAGRSTAPGRNGNSLGHAVVSGDADGGPAPDPPAVALPRRHRVDPPADDKPAEDSPDLLSLLGRPYAADDDILDRVLTALRHL